MRPPNGCGATFRDVARPPPSLPTSRGRRRTLARRMRNKRHAQGVAASNRVSPTTCEEGRRPMNLRFRTVTSSPASSTVIGVTTPVVGGQWKSVMRKESTMNPNNSVSVQFDCGRGHVPHPLCVQVDRGVPPELRCVPGQPSRISWGRGGCPIPADLPHRVAKELQDNFQECKRRGFVLITS